MGIGECLMIKIFTADYIFPVSSDPIRNGAVAVNENGEIIGLYHKDSPELSNRPVERREGIIVPGFINSHCHLELSYLRRKIPQHTGLIPFIKNVIGSRGAEEDIAVAAMEEADSEMWKNGIVAVADISNISLSKTVKQQSKLYYHTFIELLGFNPEKAEDIFRNGVALKKVFYPLISSIVPHAPYSVSKELFRFISDFCDEEGDNLLSLHNQESEEENKFYRYKTGRFLDFYEDLNIDISFFKPQARNSIQTIVPLFSEKQQAMLVHNTYTSLKDIYFVQRFGREVTWCFCPNANLHIEDRLPKIDLFLLCDFNITIGTDSLASNDNLCILSELKTLHTAFPSLELCKTIKWATLNGAKFLKIDDRFGSIEKGKRPGLNLLTDVNNLKLTPDSKVEKLI